MALLKTIAGKVITGITALGVIVGAISWYQMDPNARQLLMNNIGKVLGWLGLVVVFPWVSFPLIQIAARRDSNAAAGILIAAYTIPQTVLLAWLFNWPFETSVGWTCVLVGGLFAALYNIFVCDWIAEKV